MKRLVNFILSPFSLKLNMLVVYEVIAIITVMMGLMFYYSRQTLRDEALRNAEETLEGTQQHVDNVLLTVEQTAGNFYFDLVKHLDQPERMFTYCRRMVECNPYIMGCAIAFKPGYYPDRDLFLTYVHREDYESPQLVSAECFGSTPYTEQVWYQETMETGETKWIDPLKNVEALEDAILTFCLPIYSRGERDTERTADSEIVGVMAADLSVKLLSKIVTENKPSPHSYVLMLGQNGSYIIHPETERLLKQTVFEHIKNEEDTSMRDAANAMISGKKGSMPVTLGGQDWHVFYKPFQFTEVPGRSMRHLQWSIGVVYPNEDVFGAYRHMLVHVLTLTAIALLLFFLVTRTVIRRQFKPLRRMTRAASLITAGKFEGKLPDTTRTDEIGQFQKHFIKMQQALESRVNEQKRLNGVLEEQRATLQATYEKTQENDRVQNDFVHNMTDQILAPSEAILKSVSTLCDDYEHISLQQADQEIAAIREQSDKIVHQMNSMLQVKDHSARKEDNHE